jgi:hypothetical protein
MARRSEEMSIPLRDRIATAVVASAVIIYVLWLAGPLDWLSASAVAIIALALGFVASASAVVPGFASLIHGSKLYLAIASVAGLVAFAAGILTIIDATEETLLALVVVTVGLWAGATIRHTVIHERTRAAMG